jgi:hypothetical protein
MMHVWRSTRALLVLIVLTAVAFANFAQAFDEGTKTNSDVQSDWQSTKGFLDEKFYYQERLNMGVPITHRKLRSEGLLITADLRCVIGTLATLAALYQSHIESCRTSAQG